ETFTRAFAESRGELFDERNGLLEAGADLLEAQRDVFDESRAFLALEEVEEPIRQATDRLRCTAFEPLCKVDPHVLPACLNSPDHSGDGVVSKVSAGVAKLL